MNLIAKTKNVNEWKTIVGSVNTIVEEATFEINKDGITFIGMDPAHVALIDIMWPSKSFEKFECDGEVKFAVNVNDFNSILKRAKTDPLEVSIDGGKMNIKIGKGLKYGIRLIGVGDEKKPSPKGDYDSKAVISLETFKKLLEDAQVGTDYVHISANGDKLELSGENDSKNVEISVSDIKLESKKDSKTQYDIKYLLDILNAVGEGNITLEFSQDTPLRLEFQIPNIGKLHYYLAPKMT